MLSSAEEISNYAFNDTDVFSFDANAGFTLIADSHA